MRQLIGMSNEPREPEPKFQPVVKQNVYVPAYPAKAVFEQYHGIPVDQYLEEAKSKLDTYISQSNCPLSIETVQRPGLHHRVACQDVKTEIENGEIKISTLNHQYKIKPTKFGFDTVEGAGGKIKDRFWLFDGNSLNDFNLVYEK
jgi:hypothetical protein